jgi:hypothetical protein
MQAFQSTQPFNGLIDKPGSVLQAQMTAETREFPSLKTAPCELTQVASLPM